MIPELTAQFVLR